jgi:hypothetical protein
MQVIDSEKSEKGPQRRKTADGRLMHCCCICGKLAPWGEGWSTFCSELELDNSTPIPKFCSEACRQKGGKDAQSVTLDMKKRAKDAEWREPRLAYREATQHEKYAQALYSQKNPNRRG